MLSTVNWIGPDGGNWDTPANWSPAGIPNSTENVVINPASAETIVHGTNQSDSVLSLSTNSNATLKITAGSLSLGAGSSSLGGPVTVEPGATLSVAANVPVVLGTNQTLTDNGSMTFSQGDTVNVSGYYGTGQIVVNGSLSVTGTTFVNGGNTSQIVVNSGGHLMASASTFGLTSLTLNPGSVFNPGDLSNNAFNLPIYIPYNDVALLSGTGNNNQSFEQIEIFAATIPSGQTLSLNEIGTSNTANLSYVFPSGFTVALGAAVTVGTNVPVVLGTNQTLTDNGSMTFSQGDTVNVSGYYGTGQIVVNGSLSVTGTTFVNGGNTSQIVVNSGGHLMASASTFGLTSLTLNPGSVFNPGDLSNNAFNLPIYIPYNDVALLSGTGNNNQSFEQIEIFAATIPSGQTLSLNEIGTSNTANLSYVFPSGFTVAFGAAVTVGTNVPVVLGTNQTLTDNGSMTFSQGDTVNVSGYYGTGQIVVNGSLSATGTTFVNGGNTSQIVVNSGGHLMASASTFGLTSLTLNPGSVFNPGDLSNNAFNLPIYIPYNDVALLSGTGNNNQSFEQIEIFAATIPSGQTLSLNEIGTSNTANLSYVFPSGFTVAFGRGGHRRHQRAGGARDQPDADRQRVDDVLPG